MNKNYLFSLGAMLCIALPVVGVSHDAEIAKLKALGAAYVQKWKPRKKDARPTIRQGWEKSGSSWMKTGKMSFVENVQWQWDLFKMKYGYSQLENQEFACLLAGYKDVLLTDPYSVACTSLGSSLVPVLKAFGIHTMRCQDTVICFSQQGRKNALMLTKAFCTDSHNPYLTGTLLGYPEKDIHAFYDRCEKLFWDQNYFEADKKMALAWIERNEDDVEQWIVDNRSMYRITFD